MAQAWYCFRVQSPWKVRRLSWGKYARCDSCCCVCVGVDTCRAATWHSHTHSMLLNQMSGVILLWPAFCIYSWPFRPSFAISPKMLFWFVWCLSHRLLCEGPDIRILACCSTQVYRRASSATASLLNSATEHLERRLQCKHCVAHHVALVK